MKQTGLTALSDQELLQEAKRLKSVDIAFSVLFGLTIGIAIYSTVKNGFGFFTFFPFLFIPIAVSHAKNSKALKNLLKKPEVKGGREG